ncbi:putative quinol monooxygenase [Actinophytocola oryzae]|uniref:Quinol monooxygenase YgiN n=1 Tax=Actinophytocola oryzae TaxID=502181 RepID=A0A4R7W587_9PSEU|nr:antibiotic biosynthesis monooxygenase [Actinophytocola oryzae]TDV57149.1 quinol monooxygenase YgiN [Actinophytocola oryzae]
MRVKPGHRDEVVATLVGGADALRVVGCDLYVVGTSDTDEDLVWVNEVWVSKEAHDASLRLPEVRASITRTMPLLTGEFTSQELDIVGGLGVPE